MTAPRAYVEDRSSERRKPRVHIKEGRKSLRRIRFETVEEAREFSEEFNATSKQLERERQRAALPDPAALAAELSKR